MSFLLLLSRKARTACVQALQPFVVRHRTFGPWPPQFWHDPFVIGFVTFVIGTVSKLATGGKLTTAQRGHVFSGTLDDLGGDSFDFIERVERLTRARDPDYMLGSRSAETIITYFYNLHPMPDDPDVAAATKLAKGGTLTGVVDRDAIGGALMHMLFTQVVTKRLRE
jgi:hypothetical protein